ncbi:beta-lactamase family protein [Bacillus sp. H-16]|uniref:serine hydrolase domain-containing protein n=1 Tax=Alteribacter salitolerans TaxID=2912333 RepID=UPI0019646272|nr:serine hydrolase domain-containing protein [Alteribacter salitolerans]MBM7095344.1 beta-lactamase family protein [Alteribacter salitolerans]
MKKAMVCFFLFLMIVPSVTLADMSDELDSYMEEALEKYDIPGASLSIVEGDGLFYQNSWGDRSDGSHVTEVSPFIIGSVSKPLTALAIMILADDGVVGLEDSIDQHLPWFSYDSPTGEMITIQHLLELKSGIAPEDSHRVTDDFTTATIREAAEELNGITLAKAPGEHYDYLSVNYILLGAIIEDVSGESFAEFMDNRIFSPLEMTNTTADYYEELALGYLPGYESWFGMAVKSDGFYDPSGAPYGYIVSSAEDMATFLSFLLEGGVLLSDEMRAVYLSEPGEGESYGYGWRYKNPFRNSTFPWHPGGTPGYRSEVFLLPEENLGAVLLTNKFHQMEAEQYLSIMEGVRTILNEEEIHTLPDLTNTIQWFLLGSVTVFLFTAVTSGTVLAKKMKAIKLWTGIGVFSIVFGLSFIFLFSRLIQTPWTMIRLYTPDIAVLIQAHAAVFFGYGMLLCVIGVFKMKKAGIKRVPISD